MKINNKLKTILLVSVGIMPFVIIPFTVGFFDEEKYNITISMIIAILCFIIWGLLFRFVMILYIKPQYENGARKLVNGKYYGKLNNKNLPDGKGKLVWTDGSYYVGEFKDGKICGKGKRVLKSGEYCTGTRKNGNLDGKGKLIWPDGSYYIGEFKDGKIYGKGKKKTMDGMVFLGYWENGHLDGKGKMYGKNGFYFEGNFENGRPYGQGILRLGKRYYYKGEFFDGKMYGKFSYEKFGNGDYYKGNFSKTRSNAKPNGTGIIKQNGYILKGTFNEGVLERGIIKDLKGKIVNKIY